MTTTITDEVWYGDVGRFDREEVTVFCFLAAMASGAGMKGISRDR